MSIPDPDSTDRAESPDSTSFDKLLDQRRQLLRWLESLDDQKSTASGKILDRVRLDYETRLARIADALSSHRADLDLELKAARSSLEQAEIKRAEAVEQMEEWRLRNRVGELPEHEWTSRRAELETISEEMTQVEATTSAEIERLVQLLKQLEERDVTSDEPVAPAIAPRPSTLPPSAQIHAVPASTVDTGGDEETVSHVQEVTAGEAGQGSKPSSNSQDVPAFRDPDFNSPFPLAAPDSSVTPSMTSDFLAEIDRLLDDPDAEEFEQPEDDTASATPSPVAFSEDDDKSTSPQPGRKCPNCGYTNDINAWFCGVCGADIG